MLSVFKKSMIEIPVHFELKVFSNDIALSAIQNIIMSGFKTNFRFITSKLYLFACLLKMKSKEKKIESVWDH